MRCMSCKVERGSEFVAGILVCGGCAPVAKKVEIELDREFERAKVLSKTWLQQHIMKGGLIHGQSLKEVRGYAGRVLQDGSAMHEVRSEAAALSEPGVPPGGGLAGEAGADSR